MVEKSISKDELEATSGEFSISELAREFEVTTRAIRFYEDEKLLTPGRNGRQRVYSARDRVRRRNLERRGDLQAFLCHEFFVVHHGLHDFGHAACQRAGLVEHDMCCP